MPDVSYRVPGIPPGPAAGITAFMPHFNRQSATGAQSYKYALLGFPGTRAIPVPYDPAALLAAGNPVAGAMMGGARSADAPPYFYQTQYYQSYIAEPPGAGMPVLVYDPVRPGPTSLLPVPAANIGLAARSNSARLARTALLNRVKQLPWWPRTYQAPNNA